MGLILSDVIVIFHLPFVESIMFVIDLCHYLSEHEGVRPHCAGGEEVHLEAGRLHPRQRHGGRQEQEQEDAGSAQDQHACVSSARCSAPN